jgi:hypothetical protein
MPNPSKAVCLLLLVVAAACGGPTHTTPLPSVQGQWQGGITSAADGIGTIVITLSQSGTVVTGAVVLSQPGLPDARGTFNGTLETAASATTLKYTAFYDYGDGCTGTYGGSLDVTSDTLSGTYVGQNCAHSYTGTIRVQKNP